MQKLDFVEGLETLVINLRSIEICKALEEGFKDLGKSHNYGLIIPLLFTSKSNYDNIKNSDALKELISVLNIDSIYSEEHLSQLTSIFRQGNGSNIIANNNSYSFYNFHKTLTTTLVLCKKTLVDKNLLENSEIQNEDGYNSFRIIIEGEGLETEKYIRIFTELDELIKAISKIHDEAAYSSSITLLDSGSDTNLAIKTGVETAKSLFQIFKEIWEFMVNHKSYKASQKNQALIESLTVRELIQTKVDSGLITEQEGKEYVHLIKTRTDTLIGLKVLPRQIVTESFQVDNRRLLENIDSARLLNEGESN